MLNRSYPAEVGAIPLLLEDLSRELSVKKVNDQLMREYQLLIEELALKMIDRAAPGAQLSLSLYRRFGSLKLKLGCPGPLLLLESQDEFDLGGQILQEFKDCLQQSYSYGTNYVTFTTSTSSNDILMYSVSSILLSALVALVLGLLLPEEAIQKLDNAFLLPVITPFNNAMMACAMPVAFSSLVAMILTVHQSMERDSKLGQLVMNYFLTSVFSIGLGVVSARVYGLSGLTLSLEQYRTSAISIFGSDLAEFLNGLFSDNLLAPFLMTNPLPMLMLALVLGVTAARFYGREGEIARKALLSINGLLCGMMNFVYNAIPFFLFFAQLHMLLNHRFNLHNPTLQNLFAMLPVLLLVFAADLIRLKLAGIPVAGFFREYGDMLWENLKIGSNIQALPYNKRQLHRRTGLSNRFLNEGLNLGALMNMDGNCAVITASLLLVAEGAGISLGFGDIIGLSVMLILLSIGTPNQPGSYLLSMIVLTMAIGISSDLYPTLLIIEALLGKLYSFLNSFGDIVTMVCISKRLKKR